jgi:cyclase
MSEVRTSMNPDHTRRRLVRSLAALGLTPLLPGFATRSLAASAELLPLRQGLTLLRGVGGNVVAFNGAAGTVLVDSGAAAATAALQAGLQQLGGKPVSTVFNTHYHADQTGGNATFAAGGADIIAHIRTRQWLATPYWIPGELRYSTPAPQAALPTQVFREYAELTLADEDIDYGYLVEAHTSGDTWVRFRRANVLAVGDVVSPERDPSFDWYTGAWVGGRKDALDRLLELCDDATIVVPAYGSAVTKAQVAAERELMAFLFDKTSDLVRKGYGPDEMLQDGFMATLPRSFDAPQDFLYALCKGMWAHHNKLSHNVV